MQSSALNAIITRDLGVKYMLECALHEATSLTHATKNRELWLYNEASVPLTRITSKRSVRSEGKHSCFLQNVAKKYINPL